MAKADEAREAGDRAWRDRVVQFLDTPKTPLEIGFTVFVLALIYVSIGIMVFEVRYPEIAAEYEKTITLINNLILFVFSIDLAGRLIAYRDRRQYLLSYYGVVDVLAVLPGLLALVFPMFTNTAWIRVLRIARLMRFFRLLKFAKKGDRLGALFGGIIQRLMPWVALAAGVKAVFIALEGYSWWPDFDGFGVTLGIAGFAISILLGSKLGVLQSRFYAVEDAVCRLVGSVTDMKKNERTTKPLREWVFDLEKAIDGDTEAGYLALKHKSKDLEALLEDEGIGGPATAGFHRDLEYFIHRIRSRTPQFLNRFSLYMTFLYAALAIVTIPGFIGFFSAVLIILVLGGMYVIVDDLEQPLGSETRSLINIDLTPLREYTTMLRSEDPAPVAASHAGNLVSEGLTGHPEAENTQRP